MRRRGSSSVTAAITAFRPTTIEGATAADSNEEGAPPCVRERPCAGGPPSGGPEADYHTNFALSVMMRRPQPLMFVPKPALLMFVTGMP